MDSAHEAMMDEFDLDATKLEFTLNLTCKLTLA